MYIWNITIAWYDNNWWILNKDKQDEITKIFLFINVDNKRMVNVLFVGDLFDSRGNIIAIV